jgi:response regulator RpfG family c-di-GMP phosphodiesterase
MKNSYHFILIDDSSFDLLIYEKLLKKNEVAKSIRPFLSARVALEYIIQNGAEMPPSVLMLDVQIPGMNGFEFLDKFHELSEMIKKKFTIFMLSSTIDDKDILKANQNPYIVEMLNKPLNIQDLISKIQASHLPE